MAARLSALGLVLLCACGDPLVPATWNDTRCPDVTCTYSTSSGRSVGTFACTAEGVVCATYTVR